MKSSTYDDFFFFFVCSRFIIPHHNNLKILRKTLLKSNLILHRPYASVHVKNKSNTWCFFNPKHELKICIYNDMQCSNKLNTPMTCHPQLWYKLCPINNITKNKNNKILYTDKNKYIQTKYIQIKTNRQNVCPHPQT